MTIPEEFRDFAVAAAGASGALIGLLFVALSVFPERTQQAATHTEYHTRAAAALLLFVHTLLLSLATLVPGASLGWWALAVAATVLAFAAAITRAIVHAARTGTGKWRSLGLVAALLVIAGFEIRAGVEFLAGGSVVDAMQTLDYVLIANLGVGIARAWQMMDMRSIGLFSSLFALARVEKKAGS
ncbi:hypothetical protein [Crossiella cryophila]|uniref:Uncharacterized protein n=1 Tax=Crossiella cryophila TaxID=43355 RepID=A0A7W7FUR4_9PSEU|nr:hypothetical protein [Crossiella cryophila]MBB4679626.1 hypothetical protein [Crossiella cryophila]